MKEKKRNSMVHTLSRAPCAPVCALTDQHFSAPGVCEDQSTPERPARDPASGSERLPSSTTAYSGGTAAHPGENVRAHFRAGAGCPNRTPVKGGY
jgi:hypothetical protein